jgi:hypothetical protein
MVAVSSIVIARKLDELRSESAARRLVRPARREQDIAPSGVRRRSFLDDPRVAGRLGGPIPVR